jgi:uncharacterized protein YaaQ
MQYDIKVHNEKAKNIEDQLKDDVKNMKEVASQNYYMKECNKNLKYLIKNQDFLAILSDIKFVKKMDRSRYSKIIISMDKLMKVYVYILIDKYDVNTHIPIFNDLRREVLELLYSLIFIIPDQFKNINIKNPHDIIENSITNFYKKTNNMIQIIKRYNAIGNKNVYINFEKYIPYESNKQSYLP